MKTSDPEVAAKEQRRRFSAEYKRRIVVAEAERCTKPGEIAALLRREGLYSSRTARASAAAHKRRDRSSNSPEIGAYFARIVSSASVSRLISTLDHARIKMAI